MQTVSPRLIEKSISSRTTLAPKLLWSPLTASTSSAVIASSACLDHPVDEASEVADLHHHLVARLEPWVVRPPVGDPLWRPGEDDVARVQGEVPADEAHQLRDRKNHIADHRRLAHLVIDRALDRHL